MSPELQWSTKETRQIGGVDMCSGGRLLADFVAGTDTVPDVPDAVRACLTETAEGKWVVWARKLARPEGDRYAPLSGGGLYPADATAACRLDPGHDAPQPQCSCGFHALSRSRRDIVPGSEGEGLLAMLVPQFAGPGRIRTPLTRLPSGIRAFEVILSGRVLAMEWHADAVLFRAARQTVVRSLHDRPTATGPGDPGGVLARTLTPQPRGEGPCYLHLPVGTPSAVEVNDDLGRCALVDASRIDVARPLVACC